MRIWVRAVFVLPAMALATLAVACSPTEQGITQGHTGDPVIVLSEGECEQTCPIYDMTLHPDGSYVLNAVRFVKSPGVQEGKLGDEAWTQAETALTEAAFWTLPANQSESSLPACQSGPPVVNITWRDEAGRQKTMSYRIGCGAPEIRNLVSALRAAMTFDDLVWTNETFAPDGSR